MLGGIAIWFPHIIGVGYETTSRALTGDLLLHEAVVFAVLKVARWRSPWAGAWAAGCSRPR
jgi:CIC family chloride channel protein